jgi:hypothetical protein
MNNGVDHTSVQRYPPWNWSTAFADARELSGCRCNINDIATLLRQAVVA